MSQKTEKRSVQTESTENYVAKGKYRPVKFDNTMYVRAYEFARQGLKGQHLADALGIAIKTLKHWKANDPAFRDAIERGRAFMNGHTNFLDYVYERLPPDLVDTWEKIVGWDKQGEVLKIEQLLEKKGQVARMHLFLHALVSNNFNVTQACRMVNVSFECVRKWCKKNEEFAKIVEQMRIHKGDFFEDCLVRRCKEGDTSAVIFANKTYNRDRGYNDKVEVEMKGNIAQTHLVDIGVLNLPLDVKRIVLEAYRKYKLSQEIHDQGMLEYERQGDKAIPIEDSGDITDTREVA